MIPLILAIVAVYRLWDTPHNVLKWSIVGITVFAWLVNEAVRNSVKMENAGTGDRTVTNFWTKASMATFLLNCAFAIWGIVKSIS
jgi:hypothetical protein